MPELNKLNSEKTDSKDIAARGALAESSVLLASGRRTDPKAFVISGTEKLVRSFRIKQVPFRTSNDDEKVAFFQCITRAMDIGEKLPLRLCFVFYLNVLQILPSLPPPLAGCHL